MDVQSLQAKLASVNEKVRKAYAKQTQIEAYLESRKKYNEYQQDFEQFSSILTALVAEKAHKSVQLELYQNNVGIQDLGDKIKLATAELETADKTARI